MAQVSKKGQLKWRNLFYFLSYCVDELEPIANKNIGYEKVSNLLDLLGTLLVESFSLAYKDELYNNEVFINDILDNPYGRINWAESFTQGVYPTGKLDCNIIKHNINNLVNQTIKATINGVLLYNRDECVTEQDLRNRLKYCDSLLYFTDKIELSEDIFIALSSIQSNLTMYYRAVLYICHLIYKMYICSDKGKDAVLALPNLEKRMNFIWQKYLNNFITKKFPDCIVRGGVQISPDSIVDTMIESKEYNKCVISDAKWYSSRIVASSNANILKGYITDYVKYKDKNINTASVGLLLYAVDDIEPERAPRRSPNNFYNINIIEKYIHIDTEREEIENAIISAVEECLHV